MRRPTDTSVEARARQLQAYRAMRPEARLRLADQMSDDIRSIARSGILARQAEGSTAAEVDEVLARIMLGPDLAAAVRARPPAARR